MALKNLLNKLLHRNQAFQEMETNLQKKAEIVTVDANDDDSDDVIGLRLISEELQFYSKTEKMRGKLIKRASEEAEKLARQKDRMAYNLAMERVRECCRFYYRVGSLANTLKMAYSHLEKDAQYVVALAYLNSLETLMKCVNAALDKYDEKLWESYNRTPVRENETITYTAEMPEPEKENDEMDEWELEL